MSPCSTGHSSGNAGRLLRASIALVAVATFATVGCGSSETNTRVLGEQEQQPAAEPPVGAQEVAAEAELIEDREPAEEPQAVNEPEVVVLLDAVCITNTPTQEPC